MSPPGRCGHRHAGPHPGRSDQAYRPADPADFLPSLPGALHRILGGSGPILGAAFIVAAGDLGSYVDAGHLASVVGLVPVARDSGRRTDNLHRPKRYSRRLRRVFHQSARTSIFREGPNRDYHLKKRCGAGRFHARLGHVIRPRRPRPPSAAGRPAGT
ncbi:IS110 family transposase [Streptomyces sp. NPDC058755]|uniref:IS110 family transposase n=1 Tax=Streptomyces sp. NPDC058755 TaxID=3346624 RepID=UPI0036B92E02